MYCPQCDIQFSGSRTGDRCPYCGGPAEPSGAQRVSEKDETGTVRQQQEGSETERTRTEVPVEWSPGTLVAGKYEIVCRLGAGGFGTVYKVRHIFRKKYYALKTPHPEFARDEVFRTRFEREIEAMERFVHPDAVMIRDSGLTENGVPYYTMDFIEGESLKTVLRREGKLPVARALGIVRRVLRVLDTAHEHGIVHRDIKPDNIMLTREAGREAVKVLDFGVAKLLDLVGDTESITKGLRIGTPKYMSPEQISGGDVDGRSDLFSLGVVFYEMLTGRHPFVEGSHPLEATTAILNKEPVPPIELVPELPRAINDHVLWMLEKKPRRRPASARVLIAKLGALEEGVSRVEPIHRLAIDARFPRVPVKELCLRQETSVGERRSFLLFKERVSFGRGNRPDRGIRNDLIWRCLPCRSPTLDPENWQRNLTISHRVGFFYPDGAALVVEPDPAAKHGIGIGGVRTFRPASIQVDRFHLSLGERALEIDGHRVLKDLEEPLLDLSVTLDGRPAGVERRPALGYTNPACRIDHVHFERASNWPLHEYFLVYRQLRLGSSANAGLRLRSRGVESVHALVLYEGGEAFLLPLAPGVRAARTGTSQAKGNAAFVDVPLETLVPLSPGLEVHIGEVRILVDRVLEEYFKTV